MIFRKATKSDLLPVTEIYSDIHSEEEQGTLTVGWSRTIYPTEDTAAQACSRGDLFVLEDKNTIVGSAIINRQQVDVYEGAPWQHPAAPQEVMVLHTLVISPKMQKKGYGRAFVSFYEEYARNNHCPYLRMDTNERNLRARNLYKKLGYQEIDIVPCVFNGIEGVGLVLLEKKLL